VLRLADNGLASAWLLERVFEPLTTSRKSGGSRDLVGIAQAHGARLRAANRPMGGAILTAEFPLTRWFPGNREHRPGPDDDKLRARLARSLSAFSTFEARADGDASARPTGRDRDHSPGQYARRA
jgi:hypothetical protein